MLSDLTVYGVQGEYTVKRDLFLECCERLDALVDLIWDKCEFKEMTRRDFMALRKFVEAEKNNKHMTVTKISEITNVSKAAVSQMVNSIVKKGWLTRETDKNDKRRAYVCLTDNGREAFYRQVDIIMKNFDVCFAKISEDDIRSFNGGLEKLTVMIENV